MTNEYIKVEVNFFDHAKVVDLSDTALRLHLTAIAYSNRLMTDGFIATAIARRLVEPDPLGQGWGWDDHVKGLLAAKLWHEVEGGYRIHDFLDHNTPREERLRRRAEDRDRKARQRAAKRAEEDGPQGVHTGHVDVSHRDSAGPSGGTPVGQDEVSLARARPTTAITTETTTTAGKVNTVAEQARPVSVERVVFEAWQQATGKHRAKLDDKRRRAVTRALKAYPLDDVLDAVRGWRNDPWTERPRYCDLTVLLRDAEHIEKFRDLARNGTPPMRSGAQQQMHQTHAQLTAWAKEVDRDGSRVGNHRGPDQRQLPPPAARA